MATPAPKRTIRETGTIGEFLNGWTKKRRTMLRFIRAGDVFSFTRNDGFYHFGQIISEIPIGHSAHIFGTRRRETTLALADLEQARPLMNPVILDSYSLFDRKSDQDADWRVIGRHELIHATGLENYFFVDGTPGIWHKRNATNSIHCSATEEEAAVLPSLTPLNNFKIWRAIDALSNHWAE